ncbi:hypothetical protein [Brucella rhizosphaerae]|uniref:hypothetical protein n=1 Tax=Brucella rhizosphaerae TaxID=571254 RepID=UPI0012686F7F|nr:hypothetical protein [Brucella rhizosphaerae]
MIRIKPKTAQTFTPASCTDDLTTRMAEVMRELAFSGDGATPENLERYGFSNAVVSRLGNRAAALARRLSVRQVASHA